MVNIASSKTKGDIVESETKFSLGFYGKAIDDRTRFSEDFIKKNSENVFSIFYDKDQIVYEINGEVIQCHDIEEYFRDMNPNSSLIDITSIDVPTLALIVQSLKGIMNLLYFVYIEPENYSSTTETLTSLDSSFNLSESILGFESSGVPTITKPLERDYDYIFLLGFEEARTLNAIEVHDIHSDQGKFIFGVPAFKPHWENESLKNNVRVLKDYNIREHIRYCGANDLAACVAIIMNIISSNDKKGVNIIPIGTKPHSLAAILAYSITENMNILFDQPIQMGERSSGVGTKHLYKVSF